MSKLPAFQFYPADWRKDPGVQALSYEERGIWIELLCLMHESEVRGKLLLGGKPYPVDRLARLLGLSIEVMDKVISELITLNVASRCPDTGALMNRRMVKDDGVIRRRAEGGKKGGNPAFQKGKPNPYYQHKDNQEDNSKDNLRISQKISPSSSSSISSSDKKSATRARDTEAEQQAFIAKLKANPVYAHVDIDREIGKAETWCAANGRKNTQRFFVNWLNRIDLPIATNGHRPRAGETFVSDQPNTPIELLPVRELRPPPDLPAEQVETWNALRRIVRESVPPETYETWIRALVFDGVTETGELLIRGTPITIDWVSRYYGETFRDAMDKLDMTEHSVRWVVEDELEEAIAV